MIVLGIQRAVPAATNIIVDIQTIRWSDRKRGLRYIYRPGKQLRKIPQLARAPAGTGASYRSAKKGVGLAPCRFDLREQ
jgi:hypothetical protein